MKKISEMTPEEKTEARKIAQAKINEITIKLEIADWRLGSQFVQNLKADLDIWTRFNDRLTAAL